MQSAKNFSFKKISSHFGINVVKIIYLYLYYIDIIDLRKLKTDMFSVIIRFRLYDDYNDYYLSPFKFI